MTNIGLAPVWMVWVVAESIVSAVLGVEAVLQVALPLVLVISRATMGSWEVAGANKFGKLW